jgi:hypothetical protein
MKSVATVNISKDLHGKISQILPVKPCNLGKQELNPYPAKEAQHPFLARKDFVSQPFILNRIKSQVKDARSKLSFTIVLERSAIKMPHFGAAGHNLSGLMTGIDPPQTLFRQMTTSFYRHLNLAFSLISIIFYSLNETVLETADPEKTASGSRNGEVQEEMILRFWNLI